MGLSKDVRLPITKARFQMLVMHKNKEQLESPAGGIIETITNKELKDSRNSSDLDIYGIRVFIPTDIPSIPCWKSQVALSWQRTVKQLKRFTW